MRRAAIRAASSVVSSDQEQLSCLSNTGGLDTIVIKLEELLPARPVISSDAMIPHSIADNQLDEIEGNDQNVLIAPEIDDSDEIALLYEHDWVTLPAPTVINANRQLCRATSSAFSRPHATSVSAWKKRRRSVQLVTCTISPRPTQVSHPILSVLNCEMPNAVLRFNSDWDFFYCLCANRYVARRLAFSYSQLS